MFYGFKRKRMNISKKIQDLREEKGWSVAELSRRSGIPLVSLRLMLSREDPNNYSIKNLIKLADCLHTNVPYLCAEEDYKPSKLTKKQIKQIAKTAAKAVENALIGKDIK